MGPSCAFISLTKIYKLPKNSLRNSSRSGRLTLMGTILPFTSPPPISLRSGDPFNTVTLNPLTPETVRAGPIVGWFRNLR